MVERRPSGNCHANVRSATKRRGRGWRTGVRAKLLMSNKPVGAVGRSADADAREPGRAAAGNTWAGSLIITGFPRAAHGLARAAGPGRRAGWSACRCLWAMRRELPTLSRRILRALPRRLRRAGYGLKCWASWKEIGRES